VSRLSTGDDPADGLAVRAAVPGVTARPVALAATVGAVLLERPGVEATAAGRLAAPGRVTGWHPRGQVDGAWSERGRVRKDALPSC
jgi:hypothetical protein